MPGDAVQRLLLAVSGMLSARTLAIAGGGGGQSMHLRSYRTKVLHHATARQSALLYTPQAGRRTTAFFKPSGPVSRAAPFRSAWERATTRRQAKPTTQRLIGVSSGAVQAAAAGWYNEDALFSAGSGGSHVRRRHRNGGGRAGRGLALAMSAVGRPPQLARLSWSTASLSSYTRPDAHVEAGSSGGDVPGPGHDLVSKQGVSIPEGGVSATRERGVESSAAPGSGSRRQVAGREARAGMGDAGSAAAAAADAAVAVGEGNDDRLGWGVTDEEEMGGDGEWCPRAARASACEAVPQLTEAFREFDEKHPGATIIYLAHSGSRLYGTNTAKSDVDLKGIFIPDVQKMEEARRAAAQVKAVAKAQDMGGDTAVPGDAKEARVPSSSSPALSPTGSGKDKEITFWYSTSNCDSRNTVDDVDVEIISLGRFFGQLIRGEIGGVETLHSMLVRDVELISDPEIVPIVVRERRWMVSSQLASWMGFILSHIHKYRRVTQESNAARFRHKAFLRKRSLSAAAKPPPAAAAAAAAAATAAAPTSRGPGVAAQTGDGSSNTSNRVTTVSVAPQAAAVARVGNRVADRPAETGPTGTDTGDNSSLNLVSASGTLEASTTAKETRNTRVSPEEPAGEAGDLSRVSSRWGGGEGAGEKSTAVATAPAGVAVGDKVPPVRKLGVIGRKKAPIRVVNGAAPEEAPRLGVISRPGTGDVGSRGAASSQGARRLGVSSRGCVKMGGERVAEQGADEEEEEEDWEEKETARTLKRGKLLMHARRGVMEAEELLTAGRLTFPLKPRYVEELRRLKELDMGRKKLSSIQAQAKQLSAVAATSGLPAQVSMEKLRAVKEEVMRVHDQRRRRGVGPLPAVEAEQEKP